MRAATTYENGVQRNPGCKPFIKWKHIDGPVLVCTNGTMVWLNLWERLLLAFNLTNEAKLEKKLENVRRF